MSALLGNTPWGVTWVKLQIRLAPLLVSYLFQNPSCMFQGCLLWSTILSQDSLLRGLRGFKLLLDLKHQPCLEKPSFPIVSALLVIVSLSLLEPLKEPFVHSKQILVLNPMVCGLYFISTTDPLACSSPCHLQRCFIGITLN